jgi:hypothetical protein
VVPTVMIVVRSTREVGFDMQRWNRSVLVGVAVMGLVGGACSGDDDDDAAPGGTTAAATCDLYDAAQTANDDLAHLDVDAATPAEMRASLTAVSDSVAAFSAASGDDDSGIDEDIQAAVAELPSGDDTTSQQELISLRDTRDIIVADVNKWLEDSGVECN